jgi:hypothetical protein
MQDVIISMISNHELNKPEDQQNMTAPHKNMLRHGLLRVQRALQNSLKASTIKESFKLTGLFPLSLNQTLNECKDERSEDVDELIRQNFSGLVTIFKDHGQLKDSDLIATGIPTAMERISKKAKDVLTISSQRAVLLSHQESVVRWKAEDENKRPKPKASAIKVIKESKSAKRKVTAETLVIPSDSTRSKRKRRLTPKLQSLFDAGDDETSDSDYMC